MIVKTIQEITNMMHANVHGDIDDTRIRRYLYYKDYDKMIEQTLDGHAWETDKLKSTGVRYER